MSISKNIAVSAINDKAGQHVAMRESLRASIAEMANIQNPSKDDQKALKKLNEQFGCAEFKIDFCEAMANSDDMVSAIAKNAGNKTALVKSLEVTNDKYACDKLRPLLTAFAQNISFYATDWALMEFLHVNAQRDFKSYTVDSIRSKMRSIRNVGAGYGSRQPMMATRVLALLGAVTVGADKVVTWNDDNKLTKMIKEKMSKDAAIWENHSEKWARVVGL